MISFKQFLQESRSAPLYHATSSNKAKNILTTNILTRGQNPEPGIKKRSISLTRNFIFARNWIRERDWVGGVIIELDQRKLAQRHKIIPYNFFGQEDFRTVIGGIHTRLYPTSKTYSAGKDYEFENQFEEAVLQDIKGVDKYIVKVWVTKEESITNDIIKICKQRNIKYDYI